MADNRYQVVAECAYVKIADASGVSWRLLEKGALIFGDTTPNLDHLIQNGYVAQVGDEATGGVDAAGIPSGAYDNEVPSGVTSTPVEKSDQQRKADAEAAEKAAMDAEVEQRRTDARAKLDEIGGVPDGRSSDAVMVEYLVKNGYDRAEVEKADRSSLKQLVGSVNK